MLTHTHDVEDVLFFIELFLEPSCIKQRRLWSNGLLKEINLFDTLSHLIGHGESKEWM